MKRIVPPEINVPGKGAVLFVGRDPGADEVSAGKPFIGPAGRIFTDDLTFTGLRRRDVNVTNRVLEKPYRNEFWRHEWDLLERDKKRLFQLIDELEPSLIVTLGNEASYDLVPDWPGKSIKSAKGIMDRRGYFWDVPGLPCRVFTTLHPSATQYQAMPHRILYQIDMRRIGAWRRGRLPRIEPPKVRYARTPADLEVLWDQDLVAFDIEVKWGGTDVLCVAFYGEKMSEPLVVMDNRLSLAIPYLEHPELKLLAHNGSYDTFILEHVLGIKVRGFEHDTIVQHWARFPELAGKPESGGENDFMSPGGQTMTRKGLLFLASMYLDIPWWKDYDHSDRAKMAQLCGVDVFATRLIHKEQFPKVVEDGVEDQYREAMEEIEYLNKIQSRGIRIDAELRAERIEALSERQTRLETLAREAGLEVIEHLDLKSFEAEKKWVCPCCRGGAQKSQACYSCAGLEGGYKKPDLVRLGNKRGVPTTGKTVAELEEELFDPCKECDGVGKEVWKEYEFNPMSSDQMTRLIFDHLEAPKYTIVGKKPNASESTLKNVLRWGQDETG